MRKMLSLLMVGMIVSLVSTNGFATMTRQEMQEWIETHKECQFAPKENKSSSQEKIIGYAKESNSKGLQHELPFVTASAKSDSSNSPNVILVEDFEGGIVENTQREEKENIQEIDENAAFIPIAFLADIAPIVVAKAADSLPPTDISGFSFHEGVNWKSQGKIFDRACDVSDYSFLKIRVFGTFEVDKTKEINFKVQLLDEKITPGVGRGLSHAYSIKGEDEVYIPLTVFEQDVDLKKVDGIVIHYGEEVFNSPLNPANDGIISVEGIEFTKKKKFLQRLKDLPLIGYFIDLLF